MTTDQDLSPTGREKRLQRLTQETIDRLHAMRAQDSRGYEEHLDQLRRRPKKDITPGDAFVAALRAFEIRSYFAQLEPLERESMYRGWADAGHDEQMEAAEQSPIPLISKDLIAEGQQARATRLDPELTAQVRDLTTLKASWESLLGTAVAELQTQVGPDDPLQQVRETGQPLDADSQSASSGRTA